VGVVTGIPLFDDDLAGRLSTGTHGRLAHPRRWIALCNGQIKRNNQVCGCPQPLHSLARRKRTLFPPLIPPMLQAQFNDLRQVALEQSQLCEYP